MQKVNDLNESLWQLKRRQSKKPGDRVWVFFNVAMVLLVVWALVYGFYTLSTPQKPMPINSIKSYSEALGLAHTESNIRFSYMATPEDLPGIRNTAYAGALESPEIVVFEFDNTEDAVAAQEMYGQDMQTVLHDNLIIASTSGPVPRMFYDFLGRE